MGRRGPKPAPTHLKLLKGTEERYINRDEPIPSEAPHAVVPPEDLSEEALGVWNRLSGDLQDKGLLTFWDVDAFAAYCEAVATYRDCRKIMGKEYTARGAAGGVIKSPYWQIMRDCQSMMAQLASRFGLTPGDRANIKIDREKGDGPKNGAERILG